MSITCRYGTEGRERLLHEGEEVQITKRRRVIARLVPQPKQRAKKAPDFLVRLRPIYREKTLAVSGAQLVAEDRKGH